MAELSPAAQAVLDAVNAAPHCGSGRIKAAAALRAAADHVAPARAWHESTNGMVWQRHQMTVIINNRILAIAAELEGQQ